RETIMRLSDIGEFRLIARLTHVLESVRAEPVAGRVDLGIGDDAAVLEVPAGQQVVATADMLVEGVDFRPDWQRAEELGGKPLAVNVSDLGAMGASPLAALACLALPREVEAQWVGAVYRGMAECAAAFGCPVVGGDTVRSPGGVSLSITALGSVDPQIIA